MNLAAIVASAFGSIPPGIRGQATVQRTVKGVLNSVTGQRTDTTESFTVDCVVVPSKPQRMPDGAMRVRAYAKEMVVPAAKCTFPILSGVLVFINGVKWRAIVDEPLVPDGDSDVLYTIGLAK